MIIGWKKGQVFEETTDYYGNHKAQRTLIKLEITGAIIKVYGVEKLRTSKARVLDIELLDSTTPVRNSKKTGVKIPACSHSRRSAGTPYVVGCSVTPDGLTEDMHDDCGNGIHFFLTEEEALAFPI